MQVGSFITLSFNYNFVLKDEEVVDQSSAMNVKEAIVSNDILESIPIPESIFIGWDNLLKARNSYLKMVTVLI